MKVAIRADASTEIGAGHIMRCLSLAEELRSSGHDVMFITRPLPGHLDDVIANAWRFDVRSLAGPEPLPVMSPADDDLQYADAQATMHAVTDTAIDWFVVDHYSLSAPWEHAVTSQGARVLAIDDLANREHACSALVDHNLLPGSRYAGRTPKDCTFLTGPKYALLRQEFSDHRTDPEPARDVQTVAVSFGGSDPSDLTSRAIEAIRHVQPPPRRVVVIAGRNHPRIERLRALAASWTAMEVHEHVHDVARLLSQADLAIGGGGVASLERLALGIPSIVVSVAENQVAPSAALAREGLVYYVGTSDDVRVNDLVIAIEAMRNADLRASMARRGAQLVDGDGTRRVVRALQSVASLDIRVAQTDDAALVHRWRNDPRTRMHSFDRSEIPWSDHVTWFERTLDDPSRHLLVATQGGTPVGIVRFDLASDGRSAELSIFLDPEQHGRGHGVAALRAAEEWLIRHAPTVERIDAVVRAENEASQKAFERAGYAAQRTVFDKFLPASNGNA